MGSTDSDEVGKPLTPVVEKGELFEDIEDEVKEAIFEDGEDEVYDDDFESDASEVDEELEVINMSSIMPVFVPAPPSHPMDRWRPPPSHPMDRWRPPPSHPMDRSRPPSTSTSELRLPAVA